MRREVGEKNLLKRGTTGTIEGLKDVEGEEGGGRRKSKGGGGGCS